MYSVLHVCDDDWVIVPVHMLGQGRLNSKHALGGERRCTHKGKPQGIPKAFFGSSFRPPNGDKERYVQGANTALLHVFCFFHFLLTHISHQSYYLCQQMITYRLCSHAGSVGWVWWSHKLCKMHLVGIVSSRVNRMEIVDRREIKSFVPFQLAALVYPMWNVAPLSLLSVVCIGWNNR